MVPQEKPEGSTVTANGGEESRPDQPDVRYDAQRVEMKWFERWQKDAALYAAEANSTSASSASNGGTPSAAGDALHKFPATVPRF